jgi:NAD(P)-dependent dehydrogenase (short-subunit alcohol dehydrogenase family)
MTRIALITGANRGIGRSTALQLAREGVDVILTYRTHADEASDVVAEIEALGRNATALQLDTGDVASFDAFVAALGDTRIDFLVKRGDVDRR